MTDNILIFVVCFLALATIVALPCALIGMFYEKKWDIDGT